MMQPGDVSRVGEHQPEGWFLCTHGNVGICVYPPEGEGEWTRLWHGANRTEYWNLVGMSPVPPEEWPDEVCAAVAAEKLTQ